MYNSQSNYYLFILYFVYDIKCYRNIIYVQIYTYIGIMGY